MRRATERDIPFVMACERRPGYGPFVGRWTEETHRARMADPELSYLVADGADGWREESLVREAYESEGRRGAFVPMSILRTAWRR